MRSKRVRLISIMVGVLLLLLLSFLSLLSVFIVYNRFKSTKEGFHTEESEYSYFTHYPVTKESLFGSRELGEDLQLDFVTFDDDHANNIANSKFGSREFMCYGSCFCVDNEGNRKRRSIGSLTSRHGLSTLVAALSSVIAYNLAKEKFRTYCSEKWDDDCKTEGFKNWEVEVDKCGGPQLDPDDFYVRGVDPEDYEVDYDDKDALRGKFDPDNIVWNELSEEVTAGSKTDLGFVKWLCKGTCLTKIFANEGVHINFLQPVPDDREMAQNEANQFGCDEMVLEQDIHFLELEMTKEEQKKKAIKRFTNFDLAVYCEDNSLLLFDHKTNEKRKVPVEGLGDTLQEDIVTAMCLGYEREKYTNPSVNCEYLKSYYGWDEENPIEPDSELYKGGFFHDPLKKERKNRKS